MTAYDYIMLAAYVLFVPYIGFTVKRFSRDASDFYRGGGSMLWWLSGASIIVTSFSAWSFTGGAAKVYLTGFVLPIAYLVSALALIPLYFFLAARFRQMRVITVCDAIRRRYGTGTEQFWVWTQVPISVFYSGLGLQTVAIFIGTAMGFPVESCILILGLIVYLLVVAGGEWATQTSDVLQLTIILCVAVTVTIGSVYMPQIGGPANFIEKIPEQFFDWNHFQSKEVVIFWLITFCMVNLINAANIGMTGARYLTVKDGSHAKKTVLMHMVSSVILPFLFFIPAIACAIVYPDIAARFPHLDTPEEAAYLAVAKSVLPNGMMGLTVCAIFAATLSTLDTGLNRSSGFIVVNVFLRFIRPQASDRSQILAGRLTTTALALVMIGIAILLNRYRTLNLFDFVILIGGLLGTPMVVPMVMGTLIRSTPGWSGWSTVVVGLITGFSIKFATDTEAVARALGFDGPFNHLDLNDLQFIFITIGTLAVTLVYFLCTMPFYRSESSLRKSEVDHFFKDMRTPINHRQEHTKNNDADQYSTIGHLLMVLGILLSTAALIPNDFRGRGTFLVCGMLVLALCAWLKRKGRQIRADKAH